MIRRSSKKALIMSLLSLILCISMFVSTTFAWFTDSVTSANNIIQSGNLDVELEYWNKDTEQYEKVTSAIKLFDDDARWEPGHTEVAYLKVSNIGSLALKYQLSVNVVKENLGKTETGADIKLSDYLVFSVVEKEIASTADLYTREQAIAAAGDTLGLKDYSSDPTILEAKTPVEADYVALIIYMPTTVNNDANHNGTDVPSIEMGVNLFATQAPVESDSFDNKYDDPAWVIENAKHKVKNQAELDNALKDGGLVALVSNYEGDLTIKDVADDTILNFAGNTVKGTVTVAEGQSITLNGKGGIDGGDGAALTVGKETNVTVAGGTYTSDKTAITIANTKTEAPMKLTIEEGTAVTSPTLIALDVMNGYSGAEIEINGGDFTATASGSYVRPINVNGADVTINGGNFVAPNATSYCYFVDVSEKYNTETKTYDVGNVTINGGYFKSNANYGRVVVGTIGNYANRVPGTVTINGGTFEMLGTYGVLTDIGAHVVVNDCTFTSGGSNVFSLTNNNTTDRTVEVKGGNYTIVGRNSTWNIPLGSFAGGYPTDSSIVGKIILSGGTINAYICDGSVIDGRTSVDIVADGYHVVNNSDGTNSVVAD